jgi:hypothetical protein
VSESDEKELAALMERMERENAEVSGDEEEEGEELVEEANADEPNLDACSKKVTDNYEDEEDLE